MHRTIRHLLGFLAISLIGQQRVSGAETPGQVMVTEVQSKTLGYPLPRALLNLKKLSELEATERKEAWSASGLPAESMAIVDSATELDRVSICQATDGTTFCVDDYNMALWIRRADHWECLLSGIQIDKTFGGMPPSLPVRYLGKGYFAFAKTAPGEVKDKEPGFRFPTALAITCLLDSNTGEIRERSAAYRYEANPPLKIPQKWYALTGTTAPPKVAEESAK